MSANYYPPGHFKPLADLVRQLSTQGAQTIVFADTFHPGSNKDAISNSDVMAALTENGFNDFYDEFPKKSIKGEQNSTYEDFFKGTPYQKYNPKGKAELVNADSDLIKALRAYNVTTHYPDARVAKIKETVRTQPELNRGFELFLESQSIVTDSQCASDQAFAFSESLRPEDKMAFENFFKSFEGTIFSNDNNHAVAAVRDTETPNKKSFFFYGIQHIMRHDDLNETMPAAAVIAIAERPGNQILAALYKNSPQYADGPDFVFYKESGRVVALNTSENRKEFLFGSPEKTEFSLSPDQQQACLDALPPTLRPQFPYGSSFFQELQSVAEDPAVSPLAPAKTPAIKTEGHIQRWERPKPQR